MDSLHLLSRLNDIEDSNDVQTFMMYDELSKETSYDEWNRYLRINFASSTDFYGRITIYNLEIHGMEQVN
jgi:antirestriction protein